MKNKTAISLVTAMATSFFCANSPASALSDRIKAQTASQAASTLGSSSSSSAFVQALKNYNPTTETSSSLVSKSQVSSTSGSASSLSSLMDQRMAAATLQTQTAKAKATAVNFSSGEYIPNRNVDGYSVTASGVKATPTVKPSASAATPTLVNKVKIQSASPQRQTQVAAAQQKTTVAQQRAAATAASRAQKTASYYGMSAADVAQFNQQVAKAKANADAGIYYNQAKVAATTAQAKMTVKNPLLKGYTAYRKQSASNQAKQAKAYATLMSTRTGNSIMQQSNAVLAALDKDSKALFANLDQAALKAKGQQRAAEWNRFIDIVKRNPAIANYNLQNNTAIKINPKLNETHSDKGIKFLSDYGLKDLSQVR